MAVLRGKRILFDIDGTLIDSTATVEQSWRTWAKEYGVDYEEVLKVCHGRRTEDTVARFVGPHDLVAATARQLALQELADFDGVLELPGARRLLDALPHSLWAAVTSGPRSLMAARLAAAGLPAPKLLIGAEDVSNGKPNPESYLKAAAALGVEAHECLVVEDAPAGVGAGRAAGAQVLAVTTTHRAAELADADVVVTDLSCVSVKVSDGDIDLLITESV
ncbi:Beta-phosphoglucomutase or related phosphatase, HAD superfamily [Mycobacterium rhizamassiliense]|uniref:Beta-phosphoglucomutase or related phosphatase, HAD superfamily n=1 Tax=Mycobacterium rhizamassiliense TaxID=1841860 RepID=A0A2U3NX23_9MYCO|nr:HAD-IA family hydrolase [Mycobacterium rhizamassiliense]SPM36028.1 Beta-phosphoglucomutase or related phosphatase, HAD superfamily [Mycobacterium rhizamassiliense]